VSGGNLAAHLATIATRSPRRAAIVTPHARVDFATLADRVARAAGALSRDGVKAGDRALVFVPMSDRLYVAMLGAMHAGATAVFLDAWASRERLDAAIEVADPVAFIGSARAHLLRFVSAGIRGIPLKYLAGGRGLRSGTAAAAADIAASSAALVTLTTGSTGPPKAAARSHGFLWAQHRALAAHLLLRDDDVDMPTLPIFVLNDLALGVTSVIPEFDPRRPAEIDPARVHAQMVREKVTTTSGSPAFYERLADWCRARGEQLPVRALFTGGAPVLPPLARRLRDVTAAGTAHIVYGSTEAEPIAGITADEMVDLDATGAAEGVCVGRPVAGITLRLIRADDAPVVLGASGWDAIECAPGEIGEIVVTGEHVLAGYLNDPDAEARTKIRDGARTWHRTGDGGRLDSLGRLWLLGRVKERVIRDGGTWWPLPAEVRALRVPGVRHAAYLGLGLVRGSQRAVLVVETDESPSVELAAACRDKIAPWPIDELRVLRQIPRDPRHASKTDVESLRRLVTGSVG
jgi:acyl-CoA synthetase (AMP-forming)/AMP-acid ligase II